MTGLFELSQQIIDNLRSGLSDYRTSEQLDIAWVRDFVGMPDGDELFVEVTEGDIDTVYVIGPLLAKTPDVVIVTDSYDAAVGLIRFAIEASRPEIDLF